MLSLKPLSGAGLNALLLQLNTTRYNSFLDSFGRKSGKKVQNAQTEFDYRVHARAARGRVKIIGR